MSQPAVSWRYLSDLSTLKMENSDSCFVSQVHPEFTIGREEWLLSVTRGMSRGPLMAGINIE
ncbi:hypothetical protein C0Q70_02357 [Pomacea canaliculata]|uniref:Uncharacterized protein n=1 Tax=Pomacea canaliculata TaxID=400727 RepID=A0A2T7PPR0_POMCA|nr:hypothetical protein C0Q70_02357 [Pomacea canaliculata]